MTKFFGKLRFWNIFCIVALICLFAVSTAHAKTLRPLRFGFFYADTEEIEEALVEKDYDAALTQIGEIEERWAILLPEMKKTVDKPLLDQYSFALAKLESGIKAKKGAEEMEGDLRALSVLFIRIDESFYHLYPPVIDYMVTQLDEIEERIEEGEWEEAEESLEEVGEAFPTLKTDVLNVGGKKEDIDKFQTYCDEIEKFLQQQQQQQSVLAKVDEMLDLLDSWKGLFYKGNLTPLELAFLRSDIEAMEEFIREGKYERAIGDLEEFKDDFEDRKEDFKKGAGADLVKKLEDSVVVLETALKAEPKDLAVLQDSIGNVDVILLEIENKYDYEYPPALKYMANELDEFNEEANEGEWEDAVRAVEETGELLPILEPVLKEKGVTDTEILAFRSELDKITSISKKELGLQQQQQQIAASVAKMLDTIEVWQKLFI